MSPWSTYSLEDPSHQLEDRHPASFRDMGEANEHHFIKGDIAMSDNPIRRRPFDRNPLAVLKTAQFPSS
jgi:hypothetical protein